MNVLLQLRGLCKRFGGLLAVNNLNITVYEKKINALIGPNGSGKTTTMNLISGALRPTSGSIFLGEAELTNLKEYQIARSGIRRTFQNLKLFSRLTVLENVKLGGQGQDISLLAYLFKPGAAKTNEAELEKMAIEALDIIGLLHLKDQVVGDLPYGQQKMIEIARALLGKPQLLLLDEPATGLNPTERQDLVVLLNKIKDLGITILIIEHNMDVIMKVSDWITVINFGTKICEGVPETVQNDQKVIEAYLGSGYSKNKGGTQ